MNQRREGKSWNESNPSFGICFDFDVMGSLATTDVALKAPLSFLPMADSDLSCVVSRVSGIVAVVLRLVSGSYGWLP